MRKKRLEMLVENQKYNQLVGMRLGSLFRTGMSVNFSNEVDQYSYASTGMKHNVEKSGSAC